MSFEMQILFHYVYKWSDFFLVLFLYLFIEGPGRQP